MFFSPNLTVLPCLQNSVEVKNYGSHREQWQTLPYSEL